MSFPFSCSTVKQQLEVFSWLHPQHTTAPLQLNYCVFFFLLAHPRTGFHTHCYFSVLDLETSESIVYVKVCVLTVLLVTVRLGCWVVFSQTSQIYVLSSWETYGGWWVGWGLAGRIGELPIIWCCLSCIILFKGGGGECWRSHGAEQLETEREREEAALSVGLSMQNPDKASFSFFTQFVFSRLIF